MKAENSDTMGFLGLTVDKMRFQAAKLAVGISIFLSGFYLMSKNQDLTGIALVGIGMFIIII